MNDIAVRCARCDAEGRPPQTLAVIRTDPLGVEVPVRRRRTHGGGSRTVWEPVEDVESVWLACSRCRATAVRLRPERMGVAVSTARRLGHAAVQMGVDGRLFTLAGDPIRGEAGRPPRRRPEVRPWGDP